MSTPSKGRGAASHRRTIGPDDPQTQIEENVIAPAKRGLRRAGFFSGTVLAGTIAVFGLGVLAIGATIMGLATHAFFDGLGSVLVATGGVSALFGGGGVALLRRAGKSADVDEIEQRLHRLLENEGKTSDEEAARRLRVDVGTVQAVSERWVRSGALIVEVDEETGTTEYIAGVRGDEHNPELSASQHAEMRAFESALRRDAPMRTPVPKAGRQAEQVPQQEQEQKQESGVEARARR
ncbi:MAG: hypothetical protein ACI81R_001183 [Bradymonadia bacterium]|jgi:hypothetical protein